MTDRPAEYLVLVRPNGRNSVVQSSVFETPSTIPTPGVLRVRWEVDARPDWRRASGIARRVVLTLPDEQYLQFARHELDLVAETEIEFGGSARVTIRHRSTTSDDPRVAGHQVAVLHRALMDYLYLLASPAQDEAISGLVEHLTEFELERVKAFERHVLGVVQARGGQVTEALPAILKWTRLTESRQVRQILLDLRGLTAETLNLMQLERMVEISHQMAAIAQSEMESAAHQAGQQKILLKVSYLLAGPIFITSLWAADDGLIVPHGTGWSRVTLLCLMTLFGSGAAVIGEAGRARIVAGVGAAAAVALMVVSLIFQLT